MTAVTPTLRSEIAGDHKAIADLVTEAFRTAFDSTDEARLIADLRKGGDLLLGLVAEIDNEIVGYIGFSRAMIEAEGRWIPVTVLGPIAVANGRQGEGIGTALTEAGIRTMTEGGEAVAFVLGEPDYYRCFDFSADLARPIASPWSAEAGDAHMALELVPGALAGVTGFLHYAPAFARFMPAPEEDGGEPVPPAGGSCGAA